MRIQPAFFPNVPDFVMAGATIGDFPMGGDATWIPTGAVMQGEYTLANMPGNAVPRATIGWIPYMAVSKEIGPMAISGGKVGLIPRGPTTKNPLDMIVDPIQKWQLSALPLDETGSWAPPPMEPVSIVPTRPYSRVLAGESPLSNFQPITIRRTEIGNSGLLKRLPQTEMATGYGVPIRPSAFESSDVFQLNGVTVDGTGVAMGGCRVIAYQSGWRYVDLGQKIIAETVSDGSGNFSMLLRNIDYQLTAYKEGSPDKAGITRQDVTPVVTTTIYLRDPTTPDGPGGSAAYRPIGSPIVRRLQ